ncbi:hypothetical protein FJY71_07930 [candidate division WOR-3 bacterium]|nr:hypothetical protein [candidate division WOR-3 bacterium]
MRYAVLLAVLAGLAPAQVTLTRQLRRSAAMPEHGVVSVVHRYGDVVVAGTGGDSVVCVYSLSATGTDPAALRAFAAGVSVPMLSRAETVEFETEYPAAPPDDQCFGYSMDVEMFLPERAGLLVTNRFGDVLMAGLAGRGRVSNEYGDVELERCGGYDVSNWYGDIFLSENVGPASIEHGFGRILLSDLADRVCVNSQYGDVRAALAGAGLAMLNVMSEAGTVELELAGGMPFELRGVVRGGRVEAESPVRLVDSAGVRLLRAWFGTGGPEIDLDGNSSSIIIKTGASDGPPVRNRR